MIKKNINSLLKGLKDLEKAKQEIKVRLDRIDQQNKEGRLSNDYYKEVVANTKAEYEVKADMFRDKLIEIENKYERNLDQWTTLNSEKINTDNKILESGLSLTIEDYLKLEEKNSTNYTMVSLIRNHAKMNEVRYTPKVVIDKVEKKQAFEFIVKDIKAVENAITFGENTYKKQLLFTDGKFEEHYAKIINAMDIQWYK